MTGGRYPITYVSLFGSWYNSRSCDVVDTPDNTCGKDRKESLITLG